MSNYGSDFPDRVAACGFEVREVDAGIRTLAVLERSSRTITGRHGPLKPIVREIVDALVSEAESCGLASVCLVNADILVTQSSVSSSRSRAGAFHWRFRNLRAVQR